MVIRNANSTNLIIFSLFLLVFSHFYFSFGNSIELRSSPVYSRTGIFTLWWYMNPWWHRKTFHWCVCIKSFKGTHFYIPKLQIFARIDQLENEAVLTIFFLSIYQNKQIKLFTQTKSYCAIIKSSLGCKIHQGIKQRRNWNIGLRKIYFNI